MNNMQKEMTTEIILFVYLSLLSLSKLLSAGRIVSADKAPRPSPTAMQLGPLAHKFYFCFITVDAVIF